MRSTVNHERRNAREYPVTLLRLRSELAAPRRGSAGRYVAWISAKEGTLASSAMMRLKSPNVSA